MTKPLDLSGKTFGHLTVVERVENSKKGHTQWLCKCSCGRIKIVVSSSLINRGTKTCGHKSCKQKESFKDKFMKFVSIQNDGRWLWIGGESRGYGMIVKNDKKISAHRACYELFVGEIPKGMCVMHKNDIRLDVTPINLKLGTRMDNTQDMISKNRQARGSRVHTAKLEEEDIINIRKMRTEGRTFIEIASLFNIHNSTVHKICSGETWRHVK